MYEELLKDWKTVLLSLIDLAYTIWKLGTLNHLEGETVFSA